MKLIPKKIFENSYKKVLKSRLKDRHFSLFQFPDAEPYCEMVVCFSGIEAEEGEDPAGVFAFERANVIDMGILDKQAGQGEGAFVERRDGIGGF